MVDEVLDFHALSWLTTSEADKELVHVMNIETTCLCSNLQKHRTSPSLWIFITACTANGIVSRFFQWKSHVFLASLGQQTATVSGNSMKQLTPSAVQSHHCCFACTLVARRAKEQRSQKNAKEMCWCFPHVNDRFTDWFRITNGHFYWVIEFCCAQQLLCTLENSFGRTIPAWQRFDKWRTEE